MGKIAVWVPEIPPLSPKFQLPESIRKDREAVLLTNNNKEIKPRPPSTISFIPTTTIDTSAPTCATKGEDTMYKLYLAKASSWVIKIINPATGIADDVFKASMMKRYHQDDEVLGGGSLLKRPREDLGESSKTVTAASGIANEVLGGSLLKRPCDDLGESSKTVFTASDEVLGGSVLNRHCKDLGESSVFTASDEVLGGSVLNRHCKDLGESSVFTASDEVLGGSVLNRHCKDLGESNETVVAESASATPTTNTGGAASGDN